MKPASFLTTFILSSFFITASAQDKEQSENLSPAPQTVKKGPLNFFVIAKRKKGKLDPATRFNVLRTKLKSLTRPKNFVAIVAKEAHQESSNILHSIVIHKFV